MYLGDYHRARTEIDQEYFVDDVLVNHDGLNGQVNGIEVNHHLITPFHFDQFDLADGKTADLEVDRQTTQRDSEDCWSSRASEFEKERPEYRKDCPCLNGKDSYIMFEAKAIDLEYKDALMGHIEFSYTSQSDKFLLGGIFSEDGAAYMLMIKKHGQFKLILKGGDDVITVHCDAYNPDQTSYVNLRFGVLKNGNKEHNAGMTHLYSL